jgi:hypothetical protein
VKNGCIHPAFFSPRKLSLTIPQERKKRQGLRVRKMTLAQVAVMYFSTDAEKEALPKNVLGVVQCIFPSVI